MFFFWFHGKQKIEELKEQHQQTQAKRAASL